MQWKINRYKREMDERLDRWRQIFLSAMSKQRSCPACRALVDRKAKVCPFCSESIAGMGRERSIVDLVLPSQGRITIYLLTVNAVLFVMTLIASQRLREGEFQLGNLMGNIDAYTLVRFGAKYGILISEGEWWRLVTPVFLHGGLIHLAFNTWVLFDLGPAVEALYGRNKFLVLYVVSGIGGVVASYIWRPMGISIGASGALFGLIGAMIAYGYRRRSSAGDSVKNMFVKWAVYGLVFGFIVPGIDNAAHIGGMIAGIGFGWLVTDMPSVTRESIIFWKILSAAVAVLVVASFLLVGLRATG